MPELCGIALKQDMQTRGNMTDIQKQLLQILRCQLFGGEQPEINPKSYPAILKEAKAQTVFTTVFSLLGKQILENSPELYPKNQEAFFANITANTNNFMQHGELHAIMSENGIPYCAIKGIASAYYYPEASLRDMGDVDYLVDEIDFSRAKSAVINAGFEFDHGDGDDDIHMAFARKEPYGIWEQHRFVNGVPGGAAGVRIKREINKTISTSRLITLDGVTCRIPDEFRHGLIMLLHVISHMTSEGIGLRHLCDWAVFANSFESAEFSAVFESKLKSYGMWKFAQILTLVSEKYLGISRKEWAHSANVSDGLLDGVIDDIISGGNFGKKDMNRYREIKYISNRGERTVDNKGIVAQAVSTMNKKVYDDYKWISRKKVFLPVGWVAEGGKYAALLLSGKRKNKDTSAMLREAGKRKSIYGQMELFKTK